MTVTDPLSLVMITYHPWPSSHKTITNDHDYHSLLVIMTSYSWLTLVLSLMSYHPCLVSHVYLWPWLMTIMPYDLQLITRDYHSRPSSMTITHDHQVWSLDFSPMTSHSWLLRSSHQWPWLTIGDFPSHDHHPWAWHPPYDHDFSPMTSHPTTMTTLWPWCVLNDHQDTHPMTIRMVSNAHFGSLLWSAHMDCLRGEYDVHYDRHIHFDRHIHCAWGEYERSMREYERMRVWYPLIKMTEMIEMIERTKEGQKRFWWYFLNIVCFLMFLCIVVWVWVVSGVSVVCVLVGVGDWYKRSWVGKWVAPAILGD